MEDISILINAVKQKERTQIYLVLSALYTLKANIAPIPASKITDLLNLHLGKNKLSNLSDILRKYSAYVIPVEKGPPLLWKLTEKGIEHLKKLSGLSLNNSTQHNYESDVGIVCALEYPEFSAVINATGGIQNWKEVSNAKYAHIYRETRLERKGLEPLRIVGITSTSMGLTAAAIATTQLILQFKPRIVVMIGIAAGTHSSNKQFGDILVADPSVDYNSGKVVFSDGIRAFQPDPYPIGINTRIRSVLQKYRSNHPIFSEIRKRWNGKVPVEANRLHIGPLGAADQVIDDETLILEIQKNWRKLIGVEMETYGVYRAAYEAPDPKPRFVSFKAVCDFAAQKSDSWQDYAAFLAAEFSIEFLRNEWDAIWPST